MEARKETQKTTDVDRRKTQRPKLPKGIYRYLRVSNQALMRKHRVCNQVCRTWKMEM